MKKVFTILIGLIFFLQAQVVLAVGVGVRPRQINLNMDVNQRVRTKVLVMNVSQGAAMYTVYADEMQDVIKVNPANFRLEAGGTQIVEVAIDKQIPGKVETNLSVVAKSMGRQGLRPGSGVKIPISVCVTGLPIIWVLVIAGCLAVGLVVVNIQKTINNKQRTK